MSIEYDTKLQIVINVYPVLGKLKPMSKYMLKMGLSLCEHAKAVSVFVVYMLRTLVLKLFSANPMDSYVKLCSPEAQ